MMKATPAAESVEAIEDRRVQEHFLGIMLMISNSRHYLELVNEQMFSGTDAKTMVKFLQGNREFSGDLSKAAELRPITDYVKILSLQFEELYGEIDATELQYEAARLRAAVIDHFVKKQNRIIRRKLQNATEEEAADLLARVNKLNQLLKRTRE